MINAGKEKQEKITTTIEIMNIFRRPAFCLKQNVFETRFCLRLQIVPTQLVLINIRSACLRNLAENTCRRRQNSVFKTLCFK